MKIILTQELEDEQQKLERCARDWEGACTQTEFGEPGGGRASDYVWREERQFPLQNLGDTEKWKQWWEEEKKMWALDYGSPEEGESSNRFNDLYEYWKGQPDDPVIVVQWTDGKFYLWDGNHRCAISNVLGHPTIHAIVGSPKVGGQQ